MVMRLLRLMFLLIFMVSALSTFTLSSQTRKTLQDDPTPPANPVRLVFIHHSTGGNWLADGWGGLGKALKQNNYYVSDVCYGWGVNSIGDRTDLGNWWEWFRDPDNSPSYLAELYPIDRMDGQYGEYERLTQNPGGDNVVIMFKSCFPNSNLYGNPNDPVPSINNNPMKNESAGSESYTVANAKGIYIDLLEYFKTRTDKLFVVITAPPLMDPANSGNARAFNQWLVNDWLTNYPHKNVFVFDFYNCLTTNGGSYETNDLGSVNGNHHRWWNGAVQHTFDGTSNTNAYPSGDGGDDHPNPAGNAKTTTEFLPLLNVAYHRWLESITDFQDDNKISVYYSITPQPAGYYFILNYNLPVNSDLRIEIFNFLGVIIDKFNIYDAKKGNYFYNSSSLNNGEYFMKITSSRSVNVIPLILVR